MRRSYTIDGIKKRHGRLVRAVAIFFLLFTVGDIGLPQYFCGGEEIGGLPLGSVAHASTRAGDPDTERSAIPASEDSLPGQGSDPAPHEEDCFCCCAHVLPALAFTRAAAELRSPEPPQKQQSLPTPSLQLPYHPPRFA